MDENTEKINNVISLIEDKKYLESTLDCLNNSKEYELSIINRNSNNLFISCNNLFISYSDTFNQILKRHYNAIIEEATLSLKEINLKLLDLLK